MNTDFPSSLSYPSQGPGNDRPLREAKPVEEGMADPKPVEPESRRALIRPVELQATVEGLNDYLNQLNAEVRFTLDPQANALVVKVVDARTDEVIRQIPTESNLELMRFYHELQETQQAQQAQQAQGTNSPGRTLLERRAIEGLLFYARA